MTATGSAGRSRSGHHCARLESQALAGSFDLVAEGDGGLLGWLSVEVLPFSRARRCGYLVMGVDTAAAGRGIGTALLTAAATRAQRRGLRRLELTVMTDNLRALSLYLRTGFEVEGLRRQALDRGATVVDEYYMGRLLPPKGSTASIRARSGGHATSALDQQQLRYQPTDSPAANQVSVRRCGKANPARSH